MRSLFELLPKMERIVDYFAIIVFACGEEGEIGGLNPAKIQDKMEQHKALHDHIRYSPAHKGKKGQLCRIVSIGETTKVIAIRPIFSRYPHPHGVFIHRPLKK